MLEFLRRLFRRRADPSTGDGSLRAAAAGQRRVEGGRLSEEHFEQLVAGVRDYAVFLLDREGIVATWTPGPSASRATGPKRSLASPSPASTRQSWSSRAGPPRS